MSHEEQTEWPSFEAILREVAPDSPTLQDRESNAPHESIQETVEVNDLPEAAADPDVVPIDAATPGSDLEIEPEPALVPVDALEDETAIEDAEGEVDEEVDEVEIEVDRELQDVDEEVQGELQDQIEYEDETELAEGLEAEDNVASKHDVAFTEDTTKEPADPQKPQRHDAGSILAMLQRRNASQAKEIDEVDEVDDQEGEEVEEAPHVTAQDLASAPPPPILATPALEERTVDPVAELPLKAVTAEEAPVEAVTVDEIPDEALNPFAPDFKGIAEEVVDDDDNGWITHSLHNIGQVTTAGEEPLSSESEEPSLVESASFDSSGLHSPFVSATTPEVTAIEPTMVEADETAPIQFEPLAHDDPEMVTADSPASVDESDEMDLWNLDDDPDIHDADIIEFRPPNETASATDSTPVPQQPFNPTGSLYPANLTFPDHNAVSTDAYVDDTTEPLQSTGDGVDDPWAYMRPKAEPEKITFWANRPKFFGGDERRKARARREARSQFEVTGRALSSAHSCPNCGQPNRADASDPETGRDHISCSSCQHAWFADNQ